jgi:hypothetical protein
MFGYGFFYTDSRLKETLMDLPQVDLYEFHLQLIQISNNNPKTKKKIKKIKNLYPKYTIIRFVTIKKFQID